MVIETTLAAAGEKVLEAAATAAAAEIVSHADEIAGFAVEVAGEVICAPLELASDFLDWLTF